MKRSIFAILALAGLLAAFTVRANAATAYFIYRRVPVYERMAVYAPLPAYEPAYPLAPVAVAFDADDRFAGPYDIQGVLTQAIPYHLTIRIHGRFYPILEHVGTIINPRGTTLAPSMVVNIAGFWDRFGIFHANRIDVLRF